MSLKFAGGPYRLLLNTGITESQSHLKRLNNLINILSMLHFICKGQLNMTKRTPSLK